jgi:thiol-disulfide isomerase/thioredoxin
MTTTTMRAAAAILAAGLSLASCRDASAPSSAVSEPSERGCSGRTLDLGDALPGECVVTAFNGDPLTLEKARETKPTIFNFWASWCVYCIKEMPNFQRVYESAQGRVSFLGLDLLGVQAESESEARALAAQTGVTYPLAFDRDGVFYQRICPCRGRPIMPATVFVRADGTIAHLKFGPIEGEELRSLIRIHLDVEV